MENQDKNNEMISQLLVIKNTAHLWFTSELWQKKADLKVIELEKKYPDTYEKYTAYYILIDNIDNIPEGLSDFDFPENDSVEGFYKSLL